MLHFTHTVKHAMTDITGPLNDDAEYLWRDIQSITPDVTGTIRCDIHSELAHMVTDIDVINGQAGKITHQVRFQRRFSSNDGGTDKLIGLMEACLPEGSDKAQMITDILCSRAKDSTPVKIDPLVAFLNKPNNWFITHYPPFVYATAKGCSCRGVKIRHFCWQQNLKQGDIMYTLDNLIYSTGYLYQIKGEVFARNDIAAMLNKSIRPIFKGHEGLANATLSMRIHVEAMTWLRDSPHTTLVYQHTY